MKCNKIKLNYMKNKSIIKWFKRRCTERLQAHKFTTIIITFFFSFITQWNLTSTQNNQNLYLFLCLMHFFFFFEVYENQNNVYYIYHVPKLFNNEKSSKNNVHFTWTLKQVLNRLTCFFTFSCLFCIG